VTVEFIDNVQVIDKASVTICASDTAVCPTKVLFPKEKAIFENVLRLSPHSD
jgi:hypothetical protein